MKKTIFRLSSIFLAGLFLTSCEKILTGEDAKVDLRKNSAPQEDVSGETSDNPSDFNLSFEPINSAIGEFELQIQTDMESEDIAWEIKEDASECNGFDVAKGSGKTVSVGNISVDVSSVYICIYSKKNKSAVTAFAVEVVINHNFKIQHSHTGSGPLIKAHSFENTDLSMSLAVLHKGKSIEIYRTYEDSIGGVLTPKLSLMKTIELKEYYNGSVKYGDHLILYSAEKADIIKNVASTENYTPVNLIISELFIHHGFIKDNAFVSVTATYGLRVYDLTNLDAVTKTHEAPLTEIAINIAIDGNYLYTSNTTTIAVYDISDFSNIISKGTINTTPIFSDGIEKPLQFAVDSYDNNSVLYAYHPRSTQFLPIYISDLDALQVSSQNIAGFYTTVPLGIRGITILPNNKFIVESTNKLPTGDAARLVYSTSTVATIDGNKETVGGSLNLLQKTNDLAITKCNPVMFSGNPHNICSHLGSSFSVLNTNDLGATIRSTYEDIKFKSHGAPSYVDIREGDNGMKYKALFNHEVNLLSVYKSSSEPSKPDELYHASYKSSALTITGFGYGRTTDEIIVHTPYNSPNKFHIVNIVDGSSSDYIGIPAEQNCNDRTFELTGGKNIYIHGKYVLAADDKTIYFYELDDNGTSTIYDDSYKCLEYFALESPVLSIYKKTKKVIYKVNGGLYVFDRDDLSKGPTLIPLLADVVDLAIGGDILYTQDTLSLSAIKAYDISTPSEPKLLFTDPSYIYINSMITNGDYLLVHDLKSREVTVKKMNSTRTGLSKFSSVDVPSDQLKNYSTLSPVALGNEIIFPMYNFGYLKFVAD